MIKLIALVSAAEDETGENKVIKAWLIDVKTARINVLKDTKGITCFSEVFDGCGEEDYEQVVRDSSVSDTTAQAISIDTVITQPIDSIASKQ